MACRGVLFAIEPAEAARLLDASSDDEVLAIVQDEIEERWDEAWLVQLDKAWDAIHRCLSDGTLDLNAAGLARSLAILGGRQLHQGRDYIISLVTPGEAKEVAAEIAVIDEAWLRGKYDEIDAEVHRGLRIHVELLPIVAAVLQAGWQRRALRDLYRRPIVIVFGSVLDAWNSGPGGALCLHPSHQKKNRSANCICLGKRAAVNSPNLPFT